MYVYMHAQKPNRGEERWGQFPVVLNKYHVEILGVNWKRSAVSRVDQRLWQNFTKFPRVKLYFV